MLKTGSSDNSTGDRRDYGHPTDPASTVETEPRPKHRARRSAAARRQQQQRADFRAMSRLLSGMASIQEHRGSELGRVGRVLQESINILYGKATHATPTYATGYMPICRHHILGKCTYGAACKFSHPAEADSNHETAAPMDGSFNAAVTSPPMAPMMVPAPMGGTFNATVDGSPMAPMMAPAPMGGSFNAAVDGSPMAPMLVPAPMGGSFNAAVDGSPMAPMMAPAPMVGSFNAAIDGSPVAPKMVPAPMGGSFNAPVFASPMGSSFNAPVVAPPPAQLVKHSNGRFMLTAPMGSSGSGRLIASPSPHQVEAIESKSSAELATAQRQAEAGLSNLRRHMQHEVADLRIASQAHRETTEAIRSETLDGFGLVPFNQDTYEGDSKEDVSESDSGNSMPGRNMTPNPIVETSFSTSSTMARQVFNFIRGTSDAICTQTEQDIDDIIECLSHIDDNDLEDALDRLPPGLWLTVYRRLPMTPITSSTVIVELIQRRFDFHVEQQSIMERGAYLLRSANMNKHYVRRICGADFVRSYFNALQSPIPSYIETILASHAEEAADT